MFNHIKLTIIVYYFCIHYDVTIILFPSLGYVLNKTKYKMYPVLPFYLLKIIISNILYIYDSNTRVLSLININLSKYKMKHYLQFLTNK